MFLSAFLVVSGRWYYYCYLDEQNGIFENGEYQYLAEKGLVLLSFIPFLGGSLCISVVMQFHQWKSSCMNSTIKINTSGNI